MSHQLEIWGVNDPNISAQLALAVKLDLFKREAELDVSYKFIESGTTMADDILKAKNKPFAFTQTPITSILLHEQGFSIHPSYRIGEEISRLWSSQSWIDGWED